MEVSKLHQYSLAYVAEDIIEDDLFVKCYPYEQITDPEGIIGNKIEEKVHNVDIDNVNKLLIKNKDYIIVAKWFNYFEPNRLTPPNVCKGETIMIWRYANTDKFFWTTVYNEIDLRKLEKATYIFSNKRDIKDLTKLDKVYYWSIDTINKRVRIHTDDSDGELTTYDIEIDTKNGFLTIEDGRGNQIELNSGDDKLTVTINKTIEMNAPDIIANSERHTINTTDYTVNSTNHSIYTTNYLMNTTNNNVRATSTNLNSDNITTTGNSTVTGNVAISGGEITHEGAHIDSTHTHVGNLGYDVSTPNN